VVLFMPEGVIPALSSLATRLQPRATSIREVTADELARSRSEGET